MLVLSRKRGEKIQVGGNVTITVLQVSGDRVRLAFEAPLEVPILREELRLKIAAEQVLPSSVGQSPLLADRL